MYDELRSRFSNDPVATRHFAVYEMMAALAETVPGTPSKIGQTAGAADPDNFVYRLGNAMLLDFEGDVALTAQQRFENMRRMMETVPQATRSRLYNQEYTQAWHEILKKQIHRADVAAALSVSLSHFEITDHYAALPKLQRRLTNLAAELRAQGHTAQADTCTHWLGQTLLGLIESEKDAGTRLLCAELMANAMGSGTIGDGFLRLREAYATQAVNSPADAVHLYRAPAVCAEDYSRVWNWGVASVSAFLVSAGAMLALVCGGLVILFRRARHLIVADSSSQDNLSVAKSMTLTVVIVFVFEFVSVNWLADGIASIWWGIHSALALIALGALCVPFVGFVSAPSKRPASVARFVGVLIMMVLLFSVLVMAPDSANRFLRSFDLEWGTAMIAIVICGIIVAATPWTAPISSKRFAGQAALTWATAGIIALASLQVHRWADARYLEKVAMARLDEFSDRLGPGWEDQYLKSARSAYDVKP